MSENQLKYYEGTLRRYKRDGEEMILWSVWPIYGKESDRKQVRIKDLDENGIKNAIRKIRNNPSECVKMSRIEILMDVIVKRRKQKLEKICSKLETK